jgi:hypothetical protein
VVPAVVLPETQLFEEGQLYSSKTGTVKAKRLYFLDLWALAILAMSNELWVNVCRVGMTHLIAYNTLLMTRC